MLCDMLKSISVAASTHKQPAESACTAPDISAPFQLFMFLHNIFLNSVRWETKTALFQHRNISPLDVYEIAFEMFINEYLHWRNDKVQCPFAWICRQNDCRLADFKGSLLALCRVVLFFPYNINETMKHFIRQEDVKVFERQEYEQYFIRLSEGNRLPVISNGFTKNNIRELNRNIHVLESNHGISMFWKVIRPCVWQLADALKFFRSEISPQIMPAPQRMLLRCMISLTGSRKLSTWDLRPDSRMIQT